MKHLKEPPHNEMKFDEYYSCYLGFRYVGTIKKDHDAWVFVPEMNKSIELTAKNLFDISGQLDELNEVRK